MTSEFLGEESNPLPDLSFVSRERLPQRLDQNANFAPDLAVEVLSRGDDVAEIDKKVLQYQKSGVRLGSIAVIIYHRSRKQFLSL